MPNFARGAEPALTVVADSRGDAITPDSMAQTLGYDGSGNLTTVTVTDGTSTWVQTLTYTGSNLTGVSTWVKS